VVRAPGAALAARLSCGARSLGIERSWWRREWSECELIIVTGYNVSMFAALCRGGRLSVRGAVSVDFCSRTIVLLRQPNNPQLGSSLSSIRQESMLYTHNTHTYQLNPHILCT